MSREDNLVSIGIPVYNGERFIESAIRANLNQTVDHFELLICDNASSDRTEEICRDYATSDARVRYIRHEENIGAAENYNFLFRNSKGEFFRWSNADDLIAPDLIERTLPILKSRPDVAIAYGLTVLIDEDGEKIRDYRDNLDLQDDSVVERYQKFHERVGLTNIIYGLMRAECVAQTRIMGDGSLIAGDINFMSEMVLCGKFVEIPEVLFYRRMHADAFSAAVDSEDKAQFWTASRSSTGFQHWRSIGADTKSILRADLGSGSRRSLLLFNLKRMFWQRRALLRDIFGLKA